MKKVDKILQTMRFRQAEKFIKPNAQVLDIGSDDGEIFKQVDAIKGGLGVDPGLKQVIEGENYKLIPGFFPDCLEDKSVKFDAITLLAVLEHIPGEGIKKLVGDCYDYLNPNGRIIITVPSPAVDKILDMLLFFKLIDGMSLEEHYGYKPEDTGTFFPEEKFKMIHHSKFQLGLNNLFVFEKV